MTFTFMFLAKASYKTKSNKFSPSSSGQSVKSLKNISMSYFTKGFQKIVMFMMTHIVAKRLHPLQ